MLSVVETDTRMSAAGIPSSVGVRTARLRDGQQRSARTRNTSPACKLLFLLILVVMSAGCVRSATGATFVGVYNYTNYVKKSFTEASDMCTKAGMTLPVIDSAAKNDELVSVVSSSYSWTPDNNAFLSGGITSECGNGFAAVGCVVYRTEQNGTQTNIAKMTGMASSVPINGAFTNFDGLQPSISGSYLTIGKSGKWSSINSIQTVTSVICEKKSEPVPAAITSPTKSGLGTGPIVGIVIGSVAGLIILLVIIIVVCCKRKEKKKKEKERQLKLQESETGKLNLSRSGLKKKKRKPPLYDSNGIPLPQSMSESDLPLNPLNKKSVSDADRSAVAHHPVEDDTIVDEEKLRDTDGFLMPTDVFMRNAVMLINYPEALSIFNSKETNELKYNFLRLLQTTVLDVHDTDEKYYKLIYTSSTRSLPKEFSFLTRGDQLILESTICMYPYKMFLEKTSMVVTQRHLMHLFRTYMLAKENHYACKKSESEKAWDSHQERRQR